ncbi:MAG: hypothetical protein V5A84_00820 [Planctomycetota bacterium]
MAPIRPIRETLKAVAVGYGFAAVLVGMGLLAMHGCTALETERGRLRTAADSYAAVSNSLADAWEAGRLTEEQKRAFVTWDERAHSALQKWRRRLEAQGPADAPRQEFMRALSILNELWMEAQDQRQNTEQNSADTGGGSE